MNLGKEGIKVLSDYLKEEMENGLRLAAGEVGARLRRFAFSVDAGLATAEVGEEEQIVSGEDYFSLREVKVTLPAEVTLELEMENTTCKAKLELDFLGEMGYSERGEWLVKEIRLLRLEDREGEFGFIFPPAAGGLTSPLSRGFKPLHLTHIPHPFYRKLVYFTLFNHLPHMSPFRKYSKVLAYHLEETILTFPPTTLKSPKVQGEYRLSLTTNTPASLGLDPYARYNNVEVATVRISRKGEIIVSLKYPEEDLRTYYELPCEWRVTLSLIKHDEEKPSWRANLGLNLMVTPPQGEKPIVFSKTYEYAPEENLNPTSVLQDAIGKINHEALKSLLQELHETLLHQIGEL